jgi:TPR repeat protein
VHEVLSHKGHRTSSNREFFNITPTEAISAILSTPGKLDGLTPKVNDEVASVDAPYWKALVEEAEAHLYGLGEHLVNERRAAEILEKAITLGGLTAYPLLSEMHSKGWGVRKDPNYGIDLLRRGIEAGNPFCAWRLGSTYVLSIPELEDLSKARQFESDADKCFRRWLAEMDKLDSEWTETIWFEPSIVDSITRDLFQMFEAGTMPDCLRPMLSAYRENIIKLIQRMQDYARRDNNQGVYDSWTNSLGRFQSAEL